MKVFEVTICRSLECTIAAESTADVVVALEKHQHELDTWAGFEWAWDVIDPGHRAQGPQEFDMIVLDGSIYSADELGELGARISTTKAALAKQPDTAKECGATKACCDCQECYEYPGEP